MGQVGKHAVLGLDDRRRRPAPAPRRRPCARPCPAARRACGSTPGSVGALLEGAVSSQTTFRASRPCLALQKSRPSTATPPAPAPPARRRDGQGRRRIEGLDLCAEQRRVGDQAVSMFGSRTSWVKLGAAVILAALSLRGSRALPMSLNSDGSLSWAPPAPAAPRRPRPARRSPPAGRSRVADDAVADAISAAGTCQRSPRRPAPAWPRRGAGLAHLLEGVGDGRAAAGALGRAPEQVVVALAVRRRALGADLIPAGVQFLGHQGRQAGVGALAHLQVLADDGDAVVGADAHEGVGREVARGAPRRRPCRGRRRIGSAARAGSRARASGRRTAPRPVLQEARRLRFWI
jgi:hypothetical protein